MKWPEVLLILPFLIQGLAMSFDEFYFHRKRGLPRWERVGHPIDSLSVLMCYVYILLVPSNEAALYIYTGLCTFSCLLVTKDEFIHTQHCCPSENWLHSLLFVLHPVTFFAAGYLWWQQQSLFIIQAQAVLVFSFLIYQILYWSFLCPKKL